MIDFLIVFASIAAYGFVSGIGFYFGRRAVREGPNFSRHYDQDLAVFTGIAIGLLWPLALPGVIGWRWARRHLEYTAEPEETPVNGRYDQ